MGRFGMIPYETVGYILKGRMQKLLEPAEPKPADAWCNM
jgi:hypothetical protein